MTNDLRELYPEIPALRSGILDVGDSHHVYWEECGNPDGIPLVFLHGGPGGAVSERTRRYFNPDLYRIILFDQRGCGKSLPFASLENNTTADLIADIEKLRQHLEIKKWAVFGYSWGSTLAMAYVTQHPDYVLGVAMGGIFMGRIDEIKNFLQPDGAGAALFPDAYLDYLAPLTDDEQNDPFQSYIAIFNTKDDPRIDDCFRQWHIWETVLTRLQYPLDEEDLRDIEDDIQTGKAKSISLLETHYIGQNCFINQTKILHKLGQLGHIPCLITQGRADLVCPVQTAWDVHRSWPNSTLTIVPYGPHSMRRPVMTDALLRMNDHLASLIKP